MSSVLYKNISFPGRGETANEALNTRKTGQTSTNMKRERGPPNSYDWNKSPKSWEIRGPQSHITIRPNSEEGRPSVETTISEHVCEPLAGHCSPVHPWMEALRPTFPSSSRDSLSPAPLPCTPGVWDSWSRQDSPASPYQLGYNSPTNHKTDQALVYLNKQRRQPSHKIY